MSKLDRIERFDPHTLSEDEINALAVGFELPLAGMLEAVENRLAELASPQKRKPARHVFLMGPRGYGKSFLMRMLELKLKEAHSDQVLPVLLPEENYDFDLPHHLLKAIREKIGGTAPKLVRSMMEQEVNWTKEVLARELWDEELSSIQDRLRE